MTPAAVSSIASELIRKVRVYADEDAFQRDALGRPQPGFQLKAAHDNLFQTAIDMKLAGRLCLMAWKRPPAFRGAFETVVQRASWWPANANPGNKRDLLSVPLAPLSEATLGRKWLSIRALAEQGERAALWHDDPALVFSAAPGVWLGRAACIGHEGLVYYFAYGERGWEDALVAAGMKMASQGAAAYRQYFRVPGCLGG